MFFFSFLHLFFFLCVTSIKTQKYGTRTNRHEGQLYLQPGWPLPTWPAACRGRGRGGSATSVGRGNEAEEKQGKSRETGRGETDQKRQQGDSPQRVRGWKTSSLPKDPQNIAESGEGQRQGKIEARRKTGRGGGRGGAVLVVEMERTPNPSCSPNTCRFPLSCQHIRFPQTPLPTQALSHPSTLPWTQAIHPNTGGQNKPF